MSFSNTSEENAVIPITKTETDSNTSELKINEETECIINPRDCEKGRVNKLISQYEKKKFLIRSKNDQIKINLSFKPDKVDNISNGGIVEYTHCIKASELSKSIRATIERQINQRAAGSLGQDVSFPEQTETGVLTKKKKTNST
ncbi:hypothetical protein ECANGB1_894 [Enterospora canceri]|uniref:Uncharacterized protein n=1 Tax=Enterospora canceri TaxID=1081671 RepID=A0A1Y1S754_9MICR|nr:hypothetical protein ECANGB1_894 [Enterospora canceri]